MKLQTFLDRLPQGAAKLRSDIADAFQLSGHFVEKVSAIRSDPTLSPTGRRQAIEAAMSGGYGERMSQLRRGVEERLGNVRSERAALLAPKPRNAVDMLGELQAQEIRSYLRGLSLTERTRLAVETTDQNVIDAIASAPAMLSGLDQQAHGFVIARAAESLHGERLKQLDSDEAALENAQAAVELASADMARAARDGVAA